MKRSTSLTQGGIAKDYGKWPDKKAFEALGDLADELLAQGGVHYKSKPDGRLYVDIPFTAETTPTEAEAAQLAAK